MEESRVLEAALKSCQLLESSLRDSIKEVRRLNVRYNLDWFVINYNAYVANIWTQYQCLDAVAAVAAAAAHSQPSVSMTTKLSQRKSNCATTLRPHKLSSNLALSTRSSSELVGSNRKINYKFLKIKRGMEALLVQLQHTIDIANRQRNFMHLSVSGRDSRIRVCCH